MGGWVQKNQWSRGSTRPRLPQRDEGCAQSFAFSGGRDGLDDEIEEGPLDLSEPVRDPVRDDDHVALGETPRLAALDRRPANLAGLGGLWIDQRSTGNERGGTLEHVDDVGLPGVYLGHPRLIAAARLHHVVPSGMHHVFPATTP